MTCCVKFEVDAPADVKGDSGETVCIVGNCNELGMWSCDNVIAMTRQNNTSSTWTLEIWLPQGQTVKYRYAICKFHELPDNKRGVTVQQWEVHLKPRQFIPQGTEYTENSGIFGIVDGVEKIDKGWLTKQTEVRLYFHDAGESDLITIFDSHETPDADQGVRYWFRVTAKTLRNTPRNKKKSQGTMTTSSTVASPSSSPVKNLSSKSNVPPHLANTNGDGSPAMHGPDASIPVTVQVLNNSEYKSSHQGPFGHVYDDKDFLMFSAQTFKPDALTLTIEVFEEDISDVEAEPRYLGEAHLLPKKLKACSGYIDVPIYGTSKEPVGELYIEYLVIQPLDVDSNDMSVSYARHWKKRNRPLNIGHRGSGRSEIDAADCGSSDRSTTSWQLAEVKENTIASFQAADKYGVDFIEFDVLLTKDMIPVIYHDFNIFLNMKKKKSGESSELFELPISELTLQQLQLLKVSHGSQKTEANQTDQHEDDVEDFDVQPFPTLRQVFEKVPEHIGFNVEIKYPQLYITGVEEQQGTHIEMNVFVDAILKVVLESAGARRVVFSSFCPDVCAMFRLKQNRYPVMFLNYAETKRYDSFMDERCSNFSKATHWALSQGFLGLSTHTEDFLRDRWLVTAVHDAGLVVFCWGDDNNSADVINDLKKLNVDGVIYDRVIDLEQSKENIFLLEARDKEQLLKTISSLSVSDAATTGNTNGAENQK
ncbi:glycerophosphocholine phosphodiesterase GPCPD1-like isoform X2 [Ptychodera flava]|uniref:glycerophosphocholine phosphodiesterase GPCPD1-like isoform X2 n=1 Tax=Ptychodera flava TaxID=63121 RepID=UPI003969F100